MKRRAIEYIHTSTHGRYLCIDEINGDTIYEFLKKRDKQLKTLTDHILEQRYPYYTNYFLLTGYKKITEMRFNVGGGNARIYCKELTSRDGTVCIVMSHLLLSKKSESIDKKIKPIINSIDNYEYEIDYEE